jgi:hypothetical protein
LVDPFLTEEASSYPSTWWQRLLRRTPDLPREILDTSQPMRTDLDKAWHGLHFLLTGSAGEAPLPQGMIFAANRHLHGSSYLLSPEDVAECHRYLSALTDDEIAGRYDPNEMARLDLYPNTWLRDGDEGLGYLLGNLQTLRAVLRDCVDEGQGLVVTIE